MKKILALTALAAFLMLTQACSLKHSIGYVNNELSWRQSFDNMKTEVSLGCTVNNSFGDNSFENTGYYYDVTETGNVQVEPSVGLGFYYGIFSNDIFNISAGLKYRNYFKIDYKYEYTYVRYTDSSNFSYGEDLKFDYFSSNKVSLIFPDVEIKCPFAENLKFTFSTELVHVKWAYNGGNYLYTFKQKVSTLNPYDESSDGVMTGPGAVNNVSFGSDFFHLGAVNVGMLYYF